MKKKSVFVVMRGVTCVNIIMGWALPGGSANYAASAEEEETSSGFESSDITGKDEDSCFFIDIPFSVCLSPGMRWCGGSFETCMQCCWVLINFRALGI